MDTRPSPRLAGHCVIITRPLAQAAALHAALQAAGAHSVSLPLLEIVPHADLSGVHAVADNLAHYHAVIVVSPSAADIAAPHLFAHRAWPADTHLIAVGAGTAGHLQAAGAPQVSYPSQFDSEGVLALPALHAVSGRRIAILRGGEGRPLLGEILAQRGAEVEYIDCYERHWRDDIAAQLDAIWLHPSVISAKSVAWIVTSRSAAQHLFANAGKSALERLQSTAVVVPHERIAADVETAGGWAVKAESAASTALIDCLITLPNSRP